MGIEGNEFADKEAKSAVFDTYTPLCNGYYKDIKNLFKQIFIHRWTDKWKRVQNNKHRKIKDSVMKWNSLERKSRRNEVALCRLRPGHTKLTHGFLMEGKDPPKCNTCDVTIAVHHILIECRKFLHHRHLHLGSSPKLKVVLGDDEGWVKRLLAFLNASSILEKKIYYICSIFLYILLQFLIIFPSCNFILYTIVINFILFFSSCNFILLHNC